MTFGTHDFAILGATEGLPAPPPIVAERGPPSPPGTLDTSTGLTAPAGNWDGDTRGRRTTRLTSRGHIFTGTISNLKCKMLGGGGTRRGNKHGGTNRNYDTASGGGDRPPGARHGRSIGSGERGSYEFTGIRIGERGGPDLVAQSCTMGRKKGSGVYEIRSFDGKEQLAMRKDLQTFNEFQLRGRSLQLPSPGGLRVMSAPTPNQGLRREVMPEDFSLSLTLVLKSTFGKVPEVMQWELFFDYLLVHCIAAGVIFRLLACALYRCGRVKNNNGRGAGQNY